MYVLMLKYEQISLYLCRCAVRGDMGSVWGAPGPRIESLGKSPAKDSDAELGRFDQAKVCVCFIKKYGSTSQLPEKQSRGVQNSYRLLLLAILLLNLLYKVLLTLNKAEKTKRENVNFVPLLSFFLSITHNSKTIRCMQILYIQNNCPATEHLFLVWDGVRATTGELRPRNGPRVCKTSVFVDFWGFCLRNPSLARIVRPHPDYWTRVLQCATSLAGNCQQAEVGL